MDRSLSVPRQDHSAAVEAAIGTVLVAIAVMASLAEQQALLAGLAGAAGFAIWRRAAGLRAVHPIAILDFIAFWIFAYQRNDSLAFWQLVGPWADVFRFNVSSALIAYAVYVVGKLFALTAAHRPLRVVEAASLILIPFMFNMVATLGADWHMAEIAKLVPALQPLDFRFQVLIGRTVTLFGLAELGLALLSYVELNRWLRDWRVHGLLIVSAALCAATPLIANLAQSSRRPCC